VRERDLAHLALRHLVALGIAQHDAHVGRGPPAGPDGVVGAILLSPTCSCGYSTVSGCTASVMPYCWRSTGPKMRCARRISATGVGAVP
jgi:hypothetical protein